MMVHWRAVLWLVQRCAILATILTGLGDLRFELWVVTHQRVPRIWVWLLIGIDLVPRPAGGVLPWIPEWSLDADWFRDVGDGRRFSWYRPIRDAATLCDLVTWGPV